MGGGNSGDERIAIEPLRIVDRVEAFDDFPAVDRFKPAELTYSCAGQAHSRDRGMPEEIELSHHRPYLVGRCRKLDGIGDALHFRVRCRKVRKYLRAGLSCSCRTALEELPIAVDEPGQEDVDHVRVDRAAAPCLVRTPIYRALLDLQMALVGNSLGNIEQQKIVKEDICVCGERFRRPIGLAVAHVPIREAVLQALQE